MMDLKKEDIERIERYINGIADQNDKRIVESFFLENDDIPYLRDRFEKVWDMILAQNIPNGNNLTHLLEDTYSKIYKNVTLNKRITLNRIYNIYLKIAAVLLIPIFITGSLAIWNLLEKSTPVQVSTATIYAPKGTRTSFNLPDGTKGMLNSCSYLTYSLPFIHERNVELKGEAWFEIIKDENHPFKINTANSIIKVLGTSFNLNAYPSENFTEIVLAEGKIEFQFNNNKEMVIVNPSERMVLKDGISTISEVDPSKYIAWTEGKLIFKNEPMSEVARRIENWYDVKITLADDELKSYSFRGTFVDEPFENVLKLLSMTSPIRYEISKQEQLPDGSYGKIEVTIYKTKI